MHIFNFVDMSSVYHSMMNYFCNFRLGDSHVASQLSEIIKLRPGNLSITFHTDRSLFSFSSSPPVQQQDRNNTFVFLSTIAVLIWDRCCWLFYYTTFSLRNAHSERNFLKEHQRSPTVYISFVIIVHHIRLRELYHVGSHLCYLSFECFKWIQIFNTVNLIIYINLLKKLYKHHILLLVWITLQSYFWLCPIVKREIKVFIKPLLLLELLSICVLGIN